MFSLRGFECRVLDGWVWGYNSDADYREVLEAYLIAGQWIWRHI